MKHTATPYAFEPLRDQTNGRGFRIEQQHGSTAARLMNIAFVGSKEDADFIVRACNAHDDLLAACKAALDSMMLQFPNGLPIQRGTLCEEQGWDQTIRELRAAIRKAGGAL